MHSRRSFVCKLTAGTFAMGVLGSFAGPPIRAMERVTAGADDLPKEPLFHADPVTEPPWVLTAPLERGSGLGHGWRLAALSGVQAGSFVATLAHDGGETQRIRICHNDGRPAGIVSTGRCDLLIMNAGAGAQPTDESLARAVARLARVLSENERDVRSRAVIRTLLAHDERVARFASAGRDYLQ